MPLDTGGPSIQQLSNKQIRQVIASIPKDWNVSRVEREALYDYLIRAKKMLPDLIRPYLQKNDEQAGQTEKKSATLPVGRDAPDEILK